MIQSALCRRATVGGSAFCREAVSDLSAWHPDPALRPEMAIGPGPLARAELAVLVASLCTFDRHRLDQVFTVQQFNLFEHFIWMEAPGGEYSHGRHSNYS